MPANLGPEYLAAEQEYRQAGTPPEKIVALEHMYAALPKHKGTEKLQADIKHRLSQARKEAQKKGGAGSHGTPFYHVPREGAAQVALVGPPNAGKSALLAALSNAHPEVAEYPFTTRAPLPGMMFYEDVGIQLVDLPPVAADFTEQWMPQVVRNANASVLVIGLDDPASLEEIEFTLEWLETQARAMPGLLFLAASKADHPGAADTGAVLEELYGARMLCVPVSAQTGLGLDRFRRLVFDRLELVRVYTKIPGHKADMGKPYVLKKGETVIGAARHVHKDFAEHLKYARLFRPDGAGQDGLMVERSHVVADRDVLEFHI